MHHVDTYIDMTFVDSETCIASFLSAPQGSCRYAINGSNPISVSIIKSPVLKNHASFCSKISGVLALPLFWAVFEGNTRVNGYTFSMILNQLASLIKKHSFTAEKSPVNNPTEKVMLDVSCLEIW